MSGVVNALIPVNSRGSEQISATIAEPSYLLGLTFTNPLGSRDRVKKGAEIFVRFHRRKCFNQWKSFAFQAKDAPEKAGEQQKDVARHSKAGEVTEFQAVSNMARLLRNKSSAPATDALRYFRQRATLLLPEQDQRIVRHSRTAPQKTSGGSAKRAAAAAAGSSLVAASALGLTELDALSSHTSSGNASPGARGRDIAGKNSARYEASKSSLLIYGQGSETPVIEVLPPQCERKANSLGIQPAVIARDNPLSADTRRTLQVVAETLSEPWKTHLLDAVRGRSWFDWAKWIEERRSKEAGQLPVSPDPPISVSNERALEQAVEAALAASLPRDYAGESADGDGDGNSVSTARPMSPLPRSRAARPSLRAIAAKIRAANSARGKAARSEVAGAPARVRKAPMSHESRVSAGNKSSSGAFKGALNSYPTARATVDASETEADAASVLLTPGNRYSGHHSSYQRIGGALSRPSSFHGFTLSPDTPPGSHSGNVTTQGLVRKGSLAQQWRASHPHGVAATPASASSSSAGVGALAGGSSASLSRYNMSVPLQRNASAFGGALMMHDTSSFAGASNALSQNNHGPGGFSALDPTALAELEKRGLPVDVAMSVLIAFGIVDGKLPARIAVRPSSTDAHAEAYVGLAGAALAGTGGPAQGSPPVMGGPSSRNRGNIFSPSSGARGAGGLRQHSGSSLHTSPSQPQTGRVTPVEETVELAAGAKPADQDAQPANQQPRFGMPLPGLGAALAAKLRKEDSSPVEIAASEPESSSANASAPGDPKDDPRFAEFFKLLKMKVPAGAVRLKMAAKGCFTQEEIDFVCEGKPLAASPPPDEPTVGPKDDPRFAEFFKLLKITKNPAAVRQKMTLKGGFTAAEMDFVCEGKPLSESGAGEQASQRSLGDTEAGPSKPAFLAGIADGAAGLKKASDGGSKSSGGSKAASAAAAPAAPKAVKRLHWKLIEKEAVKAGGFWSSLETDTEGTNALIASVLGDKPATSSVSSSRSQGRHDAGGSNDSLSEDVDFSSALPLSDGPSTELATSRVALAIAGGAFSDLAALFGQVANGSNTNAAGDVSRKAGKNGRGSGPAQRAGRSSITTAVQAKVHEQNKRNSIRPHAASASSDGVLLQDSEALSDESSVDSFVEEIEERASDGSDGWITVGSASSLSDYSESEEAGLFSKLDQRKAGNVWITLSRFSGVPFEAVEQALATLLTAKDGSSSDSLKSEATTTPLRHPLLQEDALRALLALKPTDEERKAFKEWLPSVLSLSDLAAARVAKRQARRAEQKRRWEAREEAAARRVERALAKAERKAARRAERAAASGNADSKFGLAVDTAELPHIPRNHTRTDDGKRRRRLDSVEQELLLMQVEEEEDMEAYAKQIGGEADVMLLRRPIPGLSAAAVSGCGNDLSKLPRQCIATLASRLAPPDGWLFRACATSRYTQRSDCLLLSMDMNVTCDLLMHKASSQSKACSELRLSEAFQQVLKIVWVTGSALNDPFFLTRSATSSAVSMVAASGAESEAVLGSAASIGAPDPTAAIASATAISPRISIAGAGFTLDSLAKLATVKSADKASSALHFVVESWLKRQNPNPIKAALLGLHLPAASGLAASSIAPNSPAPLRSSDGTDLQVISSPVPTVKQLTPGAIGPVVANPLSAALNRECDSLSAGSAVVLEALDQDLKGLKRVHRLALEDVTKCADEIKRLQSLGAAANAHEHEERVECMASLERTKLAYENFAASLGDKVSECDKAMAELKREYSQLCEFYSVELGGPGGKAGAGPYVTNAPENLLRDLLSFFKDVAKAEADVTDKWAKIAKKIALQKLEQEKHLEKKRQAEATNLPALLPTPATPAALSKVPPRPSIIVSPPHSVLDGAESRALEPSGDRPLDVADLDAAPAGRALPGSVTSSAESEEFSGAETSSFRTTATGALTAVKRPLAASYAEAARSAMAALNEGGGALRTTAKPPPAPPQGPVPKTAARVSVVHGRMSVVGHGASNATSRTLEYGDNTGVSSDDGASASSLLKPMLSTSNDSSQANTADAVQFVEPMTPRRSARSDTGPTRRLVSKGLMDPSLLLPQGSAVAVGASDTPAKGDDADGLEFARPLQTLLGVESSAATSEPSPLLDGGVILTSPRRAATKSESQHK